MEHLEAAPIKIVIGSHVRILAVYGEIDPKNGMPSTGSTTVSAQGTLVLNARIRCWRSDDPAGEKESSARLPEALFYPLLRRGGSCLRTSPLLFILSNVQAMELPSSSRYFRASARTS
jgi:hypothetical protein